MFMFKKPAKKLVHLLNECVIIACKRWNKGKIDFIDYYKIYIKLYLYYKYLDSFVPSEVILVSMNEN